MGCIATCYHPGVGIYQTRTLTQTFTFSILCTVNLPFFTIGGDGTSILSLPVRPAGLYGICTYKCFSK